MDETGFEQAYRTYAAHVYGRCMRLLRQREAARDVTLASGAQVPIEEARFTATAPELALAKGRRDRPGHELMLDAGLASLGPGFFAGSFEGGPAGSGAGRPGPSAPISVSGKPRPPSKPPRCACVG